MAAGVYEPLILLVLRRLAPSILRTPLSGIIDNRNKPGWIETFLQHGPCCTP